MKSILICLSFLFFLSINSIGQRSINSIDSLILYYKYDETRELIMNLMEYESETFRKELYYRLGMVNSELEKHKDAITAFEMHLNYYPNDIRALMKIADSKISLGQYDDAKSIYIEILKDNNENSFVRKKLAEVNKKKEEYLMAYNEYMTLFLADTTNSYYAKQLGFCASKVDSLWLAIDYYSKAVSLDPYDESSRINYCKLLLKRKYTSPALFVVDEGLLLNESSTGLLNLKAEILYRQKNYSDAIILFEQVEANSRNDFSFYKMYGFALYFEEQNKKAVLILEKAYDLKANDSGLLYVLGIVYSKVGDFERSEQFLNLAIETSHQERISEYYKQLADIQGLQRKIGDSIESYKKAYQLDESNKTLLFHIATSLEEYNSDKSIALVYYEQFLKQKSANEKEEYVIYALARKRKIMEELFFEE